MIEKQCTKCGQMLSVESFYKDARRPSGLSCWCRTCKRQGVSAYYREAREIRLAYSRKWYEQNKERKLRQSKEWKTANREHYREQQNSYVDSRRADMNRKSREWARDNPDKMKVIRKAHNAKRRSASKSSLTTTELTDWLQSQKKVCYWCGVRCARNYEIDHYTPLSKGGRHETSNLVIACRPCNRRKSARDPLAFANSRGKLF